MLPPGILAPTLASVNFSALPSERYERCPHPFAPISTLATCQAAAREIVKEHLKQCSMNFHDDRRTCHLSLSFASNEWIGWKERILNGSGMKRKGMDQYKYNGDRFVIVSLHPDGCHIQLAPHNDSEEYKPYEMREFPPVSITGKTNPQIICDSSSCHWCISKLCAHGNHCLCLCRCLAAPGWHPVGNDHKHARRSQLCRVRRLTCQRSTMVGQSSGQPHPQQAPRQL